MKYLILLFLIFPLPAQSQQVECYQYREVYQPRGYDNYGNYRSGRTLTERYPVPCNQTQSTGCRPTETFLGALLGGGIAASMSRGNGYAWSVPVGAAIGGAIIGCD